MIFYSQLDLLRVLERALRRTDLPLYFTEGFNPHVKISFDQALKLGCEGFIKTTFYFLQVISSEQLSAALNPQLPQGLMIVDNSEDSAS